MATPTVDVSEAARRIHVEVNVTGLQRALLRMRIGIQVIRLGVWICGMTFDQMNATGLRVDGEEPPPPPAPKRS
jgi:hypothetical protein